MRSHIRHPEVRALRCTCTAGRASKDESATGGPSSFEARKSAHIRMTGIAKRCGCLKIESEAALSFFSPCGRRKVSLLPRHHTRSETCLRRIATHDRLAGLVVQDRIDVGKPLRRELFDRVDH